MLKNKKLNFIFAAVLNEMASPDERQSLCHGADKQNFISSSSAGPDDSFKKNIRSDYSDEYQTPSEMPMSKASSAIERIELENDLGRVLKIAKWRGSSAG